MKIKTEDSIRIVLGFNSIFFLKFSLKYKETIKINNSLVMFIHRTRRIDENKYLVMSLK